MRALFSTVEATNYSSVLLLSLIRSSLLQLFNISLKTLAKSSLRTGVPPFYLVNCGQRTSKPPCQFDFVIGWMKSSWLYKASKLRNSSLNSEGSISLSNLDSYNVEIVSLLYLLFRGTFITGLFWTWASSGLCFAKTFSWVDNYMSKEGKNHLESTTVSAAIWISVASSVTNKFIAPANICCPEKIYYYYRLDSNCLVNSSCCYWILAYLSCSIWFVLISISFWFWFWFCCA